MIIAFLLDYLEFSVYKLVLILNQYGFWFHVLLTTFFLSFFLFFQRATLTALKDGSGPFCAADNNNNDDDDDDENGV